VGPGRPRLHADGLAYIGQGDDPAEVIGRAIDLGMTHLDTADVYGPFANEETVGHALGGRRGEVVLATKVGFKVGPDGGYPLVRDARPERIRAEVEGSLRRLRTDVIDLYYLHRLDPAVPLEEQWGRWPSSWAPAWSARSACPRSPSGSWTAPRRSTP